MLRSLMIVLLTGFSMYASGQKIKVRIHYVTKQTATSGDTLYYDASRKLTWKDFQGTPDPNHFGGAVTASGFAFTADTHLDSENIFMDIYIYTFFTKHDSWRKPGIGDAYHLNHEQRHFDITFIHAVRFADQLKTARFTKQNLNTLPGKIFDKVYDDNTAMQHLYDRETMHSIDKEAQELWDRKIDALLKNVVITPQ